MKASTTDRKLEYLREAVRDLKARGLTQRQIADEFASKSDYKETEASLSGRISGSRGVPDKFIDKFAEVFGIPFDPGVPETINVDRARFEKMEATILELAEMLKLQTRLLNAVLDRTQQ